MDENIKEDVVLRTPSNIPAEELQVINAPIPIKETLFISTTPYHILILQP